MITAADLLHEAHSRIPETVEGALDGLSPEQLATQPDLGQGPNNSIGWLVWHLSRQEDAQVAQLAGSDEVWADGWHERLKLPYAADAMGYGMTDEEVAKFPAVAADDLLAYQRAVHERTATYLEGLADAEWEKVVDESYDPPVTLAVRLVSVVDDAAQHGGQAAYVRGLLLG